MCLLRKSSPCNSKIHSFNCHTKEWWREIVEMIIAFGDVAKSPQYGTQLAYSSLFAEERSNVRGCFLFHDIGRKMRLKITEGISKNGTNIMSISVHGGPRKTPEYMSM